MNIMEAMLHISTLSYRGKIKNRIDLPRKPSSKSCRDQFSLDFALSQCIQYLDLTQFLTDDTGTELSGEKVSVNEEVKHFLSRFSLYAQSKLCRVSSVTITEYLLLPPSKMFVRNFPSRDEYQS